MKRFVSIAICVCLIFTMGIFGAKAETNYCSLFNNQWFCLSDITSFGNETTPWSEIAIALVTSYNLKEFDQYYNPTKSSEYREVYSIPKETFEALANKLFDVKVDLAAVNYIGGMREIIFDSSDQTYSVILPAAGGGLHYHICGYSRDGEIYTVYMQLVDYAEYIDEYIKCTATVNDGYAKLLACEKVTSIPAEEELITEHTRFDEESSPLDSSVENVVSETPAEESSIDTSESESSPENSSDVTAASSETALNTQESVASVPEKPESEASSLTDSKNSSLVSETLSAASFPQESESKESSLTDSTNSSLQESNKDSLSASSQSSTPNKKAASPLFVIIPAGVLIVAICVFLVLYKKKKAN